MSSKKPDSASVGKLKCLDFVETVSDAILKVLRNSSNEDFIAKCFSNLQVSAPIHVEWRLKAQLWRLLDNDGPENIDLNRKHTQDYHAHNTSLERGNPNHEAINLYSFEHVLNGTPQTLHQNNDISFIASDLGYTENVNSFITPPPTQLTSTPIEYSQQFQVSDSQSYPLIVSLDDSDSEVEILRDTCNELNYDGLTLSDDVECGWENLSFSNIQVSRPPSSSEPSLHFSRPEYWLGDFTDCEESVLLNNDISDISSREMDTFGALTVESSNDSHHLVTKVLSVLEESIIKDFSFQASENPVTSFEEQNSVDMPENFSNENQEQISLVHFTNHEDCSEIQNILNKDSRIGSTSNISNLNLEKTNVTENEVIILFDSNDEHMHTKQVSRPSSGSSSSKKQNTNSTEKKTVNSPSSQPQYILIPKDTSQNTSTFSVDTAKIQEPSETADDLDNFNDSDDSFDCYFDLKGAPNTANDGSTTATDSETENVPDGENGIEKISSAVTNTISNSESSFTCNNSLVFGNNTLKDLDVDDEDFIW